ncbi:hypothetical protein [Peribacillus asahii]|uniref:hypothetical protein n=1 Tax=Peribacillus asahii TaxID=228899 RepID=UPI00207A51D1|nr:hypothetical protein [Peribacillus asahii]USK70048.1 hypothetical protein LIS76_21570 [Peribacillus asahii]
MKNNKGKPDTVTVSKIAKGDVITMYNARSKGKVLAKKTSSGKVYVTVKKSGQTENTRIAVSYAKEK